MAALARQAVALVAAIIVPFGVAVALVPIRNELHNATVALILAAIVAALATTGTRATAAVALAEADEHEKPAARH